MAQPAAVKQLSLKTSKHIGLFSLFLCFDNSCAMKQFLYKTAEILHARSGDHIYRQTFVFPNRRAGIFFQKHLVEIAGKPIFSPKIITIQELFEEISQYRLADKIELLVLLYGCYSNLNATDETFDDFLYWGEMLLSDFSDIDKHLVDAKQLFRNIHNLKSMEEEATYLTPEQVEAIRQFWENFVPYEGNDTKRAFMETWEILFELYASFKNILHEKGYAYEGMLFRDAAERMAAGEETGIGNSELVFVGLNALTPAETKVLRQLKTKGIADFYWDYESPLVRDKKNRASLWVEENLRQFPSKFDVEKEDKDTAKEMTEIELIGIPSGVGQAKIVNQLLQEFIRDKNISQPNAGLNTAVVLPDEHLLLPVLYSIPQEIEKINVTMGYGLQHSSVASLITAIASLQHNTRESDGKIAVYYKFVLAILDHPLIASAHKEKADELKLHIQKYNRVSLTEEELHTDAFFESIFKIISNRTEIADYLKLILSNIHKHLTAKRQSGREDGFDTRAVDLEREFIVQYYKTITRLEESLSGMGEIETDTYFRLLRQLAQGISINFTGEPLSGLQIMGILETRALDFENLIILSMNEGVFPLKRPTNSFIPYTLRKAFDLPTYEHQDSTYAYHFYRMIGRAKRVFMLYDTRTEDMQTGEVSRYFNQLKFLYGDRFKISEKSISYDVSVQDTKPVSVVKSKEVLLKLEQFKSGGDLFLSASNINNYINCPLQFYFSAVEGLSQEEEVRESVESDLFGTIYHAVMQSIYDRHLGDTVLPDTLNTIIKNEKYLTEQIEDAFAEHYFKQKDKKRKLTGQHHLVGEVLRELIKQTLRIDKKFTPFKYIASEHRFKTSYDVSGGLSVNVKGSIDRIDETESLARIIDYKSGTGEVRFPSVERLFDGSKDKRPYQILQVLFYALFYQREDLPISPAIYYLRKIFDENFETTIQYDKKPVADVSPFLAEFREHLDRVITDIFNPEIPFHQTENEKNCQWCAFKDLCGR